MSLNPDFWEIPVEPGRLDAFATGSALWCPPEEAPSRPEKDQRRRQAVVRLRELIEHELTARQRDCVRLYFFEGRTQQQVAEELGICRRVVSQHLFGIRRHGRRIGGALNRIRKLCQQQGLGL